MGKIFIRERRRVKKGAAKPRFALVAVADLNLKVYHSHLRRSELEKLAEELGAEIVELPRGTKRLTESGQEALDEAGTPRRAKKKRKS